jgi:hypothetical protein
LGSNPLSLSSEQMAGTSPHSLHNISSAFCWLLLPPWCMVW